MKKSVRIKKVLRVAQVSVTLATVGCGIFTVLSDNGYIPKVDELPSDSKIGKLISRTQEILLIFRR